MVATGKKGKCARGYGGSKAVCKRYGGPKGRCKSGGGAKVECAGACMMPRYKVPLARAAFAKCQIRCWKCQMEVRCSSGCRGGKGGCAGGLGGGRGKAVVLVDVGAKQKCEG